MSRRAAVDPNNPSSSDGCDLTAHTAFRPARRALRRSTWVSAGLALWALLQCGTALAQDLEPRAYTNVPVGLNILIGGYVYAEGGISFDPALPIEDASFAQHSALLAYSRSFDLFGRLAKIDLIAPYSWLSGDAVAFGQPVEREVAGLNDPRLRLTYNFYGAPALSLEEWARQPDDLVIGASLQVTAPLGQYDDDRAVNIGMNRWTVKPEIGASKSWGPFSLELSAGVTIFEDNDDFLGFTREQDPLYAFQSHLVYSFRRSLWVAFDWTYYLGGRTELDGNLNDDSQSSSRVGLTFSVPLSARFSAKIYGSTGVSSRVGGDWDAVGVTLQVRWGAGV